MGRLLAICILAVSLAACADVPKPFDGTNPTAEPIGCTLLKQRKGEC